MTNIDYIIKNRLVEISASKLRVSFQYKEDFVQEIYLILLEYEKLPIIKQELMPNLVYRICKFQWSSNNSRFFYKYRKNNIQTMDIDAFVEDINEYNEPTFKIKQENED